jgi:hypothetical protein
MLLLVLYVIGNVQVESIHQVFHSVDKALHSLEQEKDPCHRAIYHEVKNEGCDHKTHVTAIKRCPLCHVVPFNDQHASAGEDVTASGYSVSYQSVLHPLSLPDPLYNLSARAPPFS